MHNQILHAISLPVLLLDESCTIKFINNTFSKQFGFQADALVNQPGTAVFAEESLDRIHQHILHSGSDSTEIIDRLSIHLQHSDETWNIGIISLHKLSLDEYKSPLTLIQILSTENIETGRATENLGTNIYRELLEHLPGFTYLCKNDADYSILYIGEKVIEFLGYAPEEFKNNDITLASLIDSIEFHNIKHTVDEALRNREAFHLSYKMKHRNGDWVLMNETGTGIYNNQGDLLFLMGYFTSSQKLDSRR